MSTKLANELHLVIHQNLEDLLPSICEAWKEARQGRRKSKVSFVGIDDIEEQASCTWHPSLEELITGGLESAFWMMDKAALASKKEWKVTIRVSQKIQKSEFWNVTYPSGFHRLDEPPEKISAL